MLLTQSEFFKRLNQKSYQKSAMPGADGDIVQCIVPSATDRRIQIFTSAGNLYTVPASDIPECKLKDKGKPLSAILAGTDKNERIAGVFSVSDYNEGAELFFVTKNGMIKRSKLSDYNVRNKKIAACGLGAGDEVISVTLMCEDSDWIVVTRSGMAVRFNTAEVSCIGARRQRALKRCSLEKGDAVVMASPRRRAGRPRDIHRPRFREADARVPL